MAEGLTSWIRFPVTLDAWHFRANDWMNKARTLILAQGARLEVVEEVAASATTPIVGTVVKTVGWKRHSLPHTDLHAQRTNDGLVMLMGLVARDGGDTAAGVTSTVGTLPSGYRPLWPVLAPAMAQVGATGDCQLIQVSISTAGVITVRSNIGFLADRWVTFEGLMFRTHNPYVAP